MVVITRDDVLPLLPFTESRQVVHENHSGHARLHLLRRRALSPLEPNLGMPVANLTTIKGLTP